ncbi:MAG: hypothetical protein V3T31_09660, partial [candidate division Zixibacteria bacterium]
MAGLFMYAGFIKHVSFPFYQWKHGSDYLKRLKTFEHSQWLPPERLREMQWQRLRKILDHAYRNVPYYKEIFAILQASPEDFRSFDDFVKFPTLTKQTLQSRLNDMIATNIPKENLHRGVTSGSSGQPTYYVQDLAGNRIRKAAGRRLMKMAGYDIGLRVFYFWRASPFTILGDKTVSNLEEAATNPSLLVRLKRAAYERFGVDNPILRFDPTMLNESQMVKVYQELRRFRPHMIVSYVSALYRLAQFLESENLVEVRPGSIVTSSETLYQHQRELIEKVFQCPVYNRYGLQETGVVGVECCERKGLHYNQEILHVEYVSTATESKQLVITDLINQGMPLLRYETGDSAQPVEGVCACGRGLERIGEIEGRIIELLPTRLGGHINGQLFATFHWIKGIRQYQVIQTKIDAFRIRIASDKSFMESDLTPMLDIIREKFGQDVEIEIDYADSISFTDGGKYKLV